MSGPWWQVHAASCAADETTKRREGLTAIGAGVRAQLHADAELIALLIGAMDDADPYNAGCAAGVLRMAAQYRAGNIAAAAHRLAEHLTNTASQELRKESGAALVELAENGPGIPSEALATLEGAAVHRMKHARQLAAAALAADALDRRDVARFAWLCTQHPRPDVRERCVAYLVRGSEWRDALPFVPLLLDGLRAAGSSPDRRRYLTALFAVLTVPRDAGASPERAEAGAQTLHTLDALGLSDDAPEVESARRVARNAATSMDRWKAAAAVMSAWLTSEGRPAGWDEVVANLSRGQRGDLWDLAHHVQAWPVLRAAMWHPSASVRVEVLQRLSIIAIRSMRPMTAIVPSVRACLDDPDAGVRQAALSLVESLAMFGSALERTDLSTVAVSLKTVAGSEGEDGLRADAILKIGQLFGGIG